MRIVVDVNVFIDVLAKRANWDGSLRVLNEEFLAMEPIAALEAMLNH